METMLIELTNAKAAKLLQHLEELQLIKVLHTTKPLDVALSTKYAGSLPEEIANEMQNRVKESRNEWDSRNT